MLVSDAVERVLRRTLRPKDVSDVRAAAPMIEGACCKDGEKLLGWISMGTPKGPPKARGEIDRALILSSFA